MLRLIFLHHTCDQSLIGIYVFCDREHHILNGIRNIRRFLRTDLSVQIPLNIAAAVDCRIGLFHQT